MSTKMLSKFDPFSMSADMVRRIATGRKAQASPHFT